MMGTACYLVPLLTSNLQLYMVGNCKDAAGRSVPDGQGHDGEWSVLQQCANP